MAYYSPGKTSQNSGDPPVADVFANLVGATPQTTRKASDPYFSALDYSDPFPPAWIYGSQPNMDAATAWNLAHMKYPPGPNDFSSPPAAADPRTAIAAAIIQQAVRNGDVLPAYLPGGGQPGGADATTGATTETGAPTTEDDGSRQPEVEAPPQETPEQQAPPQAPPQQAPEQQAPEQQAPAPQTAPQTAPPAAPQKGFVGFQQSDMPDIDQPALTPYGIPTMVQDSPLSTFKGEPAVPLAPTPTPTPEAPKGLPDVDPLGQPLGTPNIGQPAPQKGSLAAALAEKGEVQAPIGAPVTAAEQHDMDKATLAQLAALQQQAEIDQAITDIAEKGVIDMGPPPDVQQSVQEAAQQSQTTAPAPESHAMSQTAAENEMGLTGQPGPTAASLAAAAAAQLGSPTTSPHGSQTAAENALGLTGAPTAFDDPNAPDVGPEQGMTTSPHGSQTAAENALGLTSAPAAPTSIQEMQTPQTQPAMPTPAQKSELEDPQKADVDKAVTFALAQLALEDPQTVESVLGKQEAPVMAMDPDKADPNSPEGRAQTFADQAAFETAVSGILGHQFGYAPPSSPTVAQPSTLSALADAYSAINQAPMADPTTAAPMSFADALSATLSAMNPAMMADDPNAPDTTATAPDDTATTDAPSLAEAVSPTMGFSDAEAAAVAQAAANLGAPSTADDAAAAATGANE